MTTITFPLKLQMKGPKVADLHAALQSLGYVIADAEKSTRRFGATTRQALLDFQSKHGLAPSGEVDELAAAHLNQALASLGIVDDENKWRVHGRITYRDGQPAAHMQVRVYDRDVTSETLLGETTTDNDGHYTLTYSESQFRRTSAERGGPELLLRVFDQDSMLLGQSKMLRNAPAEATLDAQVSTGMFRVFGRVAKQDGGAGSGLKVVAVDRDLRKEEALGTAVTDVQGRYEILYSREQFARAEKDRADLVVRVFEAPASGSTEPGTPLAESAIRFNAPAETEIDLSLPRTETEPSEYERYVASLSPLLEGQDVSWATLSAEDIDFLVGDTGMDRGRIATLALSMQRSGETALPSLNQAGHFVASIHISLIEPEVFYGWFRQGLPTTLAALLGHSSDALRQALRDAVAANIVPASLAESLDDIIARVQQLKAGRILRPSRANEPASLGDLLAVAVDAGKHELIAKLFVEQGGETDAFLKALEKDSGVTPADVKAVRQTLALGDFTSKHLPLIRELYQMGKDKAAFVELRGFAQLDETQWQVVLQRPQEPGDTNSKPIGFPSGQESIQSYARTLNQYIETTFPTAVISNRLQRDDSNESPFKETKADLLVFFGNNPEFSFATTPPDLYLSDAAGEKLRGIEQPEALRAQLKSMQRVFNITPRFPEIRILLADDLHSATAIVGIGEGRFTNKYAELLGGKSKALEAYRKAEHVHATEKIGVGS